MSCCMSCKHKNSLLLVFPAVCLIRLSACASAGLGAGDIPGARCRCNALCLLHVETDSPFFAAGTRPSSPCVALVVSKTGDFLVLSLSGGGFVSGQLKKLVRRQEKGNGTKETSNKILCVRQHEKYL